MIASCYEPPVAAHWDGDVLVLTTTRDPSSIHVQQGDGQQRKVYTGEPELFAPSIKDGWQGALCKRIDELCQENERLRQELAIRESSEQEKVIDYLGKECVDWEDKYLALAGDNAKLRKLVDGITFCSTTSSRSDDCIGCPLLDQSTHNYRCTKTECMIDLGFEVPS